MTATAVSRSTIDEVPGRTAPPVRLPGLSIVLPCFNEEPNVVRAVHEAIAAARAVAENWEVIVVDDGSADRTRVIAEALALADDHVVVVAHAENRGYGAAVRSGFGAARMHWLLLTDGDLQFDLGELPLLVREAPEADIVAGFRIERQDPAHRRLNARAWNALVRALFPVPVRDVDCAFKLMRRPVVRRLDLQADGAMVSTELVAKAACAGARVVEVGVHHRPRLAGEASGANLRVIARAFRELLVVRRRLRAAPVPAAAASTALPAGS